MEGVRPGRSGGHRGEEEGTTLFDSHPVRPRYGATCTCIIFPTYPSTHQPNKHPKAPRAGPSGKAGGMEMNHGQALPSESLRSAGRHNASYSELTLSCPIPRKAPNDPGRGGSDIIATFPMGQPSLRRDVTLPAAPQSTWHR